ncbi:MAG: RidA/YER057c/UK114 superfamily, group 1 [uncultured Solirubrobacteraceae bacterium]|uniref:RidA/YER057c/UK114 superfamily, group 1 n=1 Tax=uncultured Solirubrobacteraceae bacterium TaxID=1162706 RepID=A0A6J4SCL3_9ACTN|nr:MAG: RidA/YER057c/UK114 superfamily, group 1 [uncultured Solirubrobacteraceae bacterium]
MNEEIASRLARQGIALAMPVAPRHAYVPATTSGDVLFLSGKTPKEEGRLVLTGRLGSELEVSEGVRAARVAAVSALASLEDEVGLERVTRILKLTGYVASADGFFEQSAVVDGASELFADILGEAGRHARTAIGVACLPGNAPVELDLVVEVR